MLINKPSVLLTARVCARLDAVADVVDRQARRDGLPVDAEVAAALDAIRAVGRGYRQNLRARPAGSVSGTSGIPLPDRRPMLPVMATAEVALTLGISTRAVRGLAQRGSLPARRSGRAWLFDQLDVDEFRQRHEEGS